MYRKLASTADRIEAVLRERRAPAVVVGGRVLPGFVEMLLRPAPGTRVSQLKALQADLALALGNANVRLVQSGEHLAVHIPRTQRSVVRLSQLLQRARQAPMHTAMLGLAEDGSVLMANLAAPEVAHILIAGATGSGKTVLARSIVLSLCARHRPSQFGLVVIDPKQHEEDAFAQAVRRHLLLPVARAPEEAQSVIARVVQVMEQRTPHDAANPRVLVYVDELADVCQTGGSGVVEQLTRIAQRGREVGVHLLACTQKPTARAIGSLLKANLPLRLVGRVASPEDARVAAGRGGTNAERLLGSGDFIAVSGATCIRFQAAYPDVI
ncbi:MAG: DNA translocase FtsK [Thermoflexales bacterium]|nr:DNA translocase FtsK [Thermoflexales bacterium]MDW8293075.1 DNA translocase FtsK [Anaerolineae bacterium]